MTSAQFQSFLAGAALVCAVGVVLNLALMGRRGRSAVVLALAFLVMGGTLLALRAGAPGWTVGLGAAVAVSLLAADVVGRTGGSAK